MTIALSLECKTIIEIFFFLRINKRIFILLQYLFYRLNLEDTLSLECKTIQGNTIGLE